ncbi:MAG: HpcH/HpaI aldolase family protein [Peptococcales bacterium]|jgi:4-hydroxy-2-oxoheptanedioate aldolase
MKNIVLEKFKQNQKTIGTFVQLQSITAMECLGYSGLDYCIIDMEHSPLNTEGSERLIAAAQASGITPFVRVSEISRSQILKMLDAGAQGLIIPCVETVEQVQELINYAKYTPIGKRGFCLSRAAGWGYAPHAMGSIEDYMKISNQETLLIPQCETLGSLEHIEEIIALDGVDGILIGPYDLSIALGKPGQVDDLEVKQSFARILNACKAVNKMCFIYAGSSETANRYFAEGFDSVSIGVDNAVLINGYQNIVSKIKMI